jgi:hypothetical protein
LLPGFEAAGTPQTFLILNSQPGDYMGQGQYQVFTPSDGTFSAQSVYRGGLDQPGISDLLAGAAQSYISEISCEM